MDYYGRIVSKSNQLLLLTRNGATFVSELLDISKMQQIKVTVMSPNHYQQLITFQLQSISHIEIVNFLILRQG